MVAPPATALQLDSKEGGQTLETFSYYTQRRVEPKHKIHLLFLLFLFFFFFFLPLLLLLLLPPIFLVLALLFFSLNSCHFNRWGHIITNDLTINAGANSPFPSEIFSLSVCLSLCLPLFSTSIVESVVYYLPLPCYRLRRSCRPTRLVVSVTIDRNILEHIPAARSSKTIKWKNLETPANNSKKIKIKISK